MYEPPFPGTPLVLHFLLLTSYLLLTTYYFLFISYYLLLTPLRKVASEKAADLVASQISAARRTAQPHPTLLGDACARGQASDSISYE